MNIGELDHDETDEQQMSYFDRDSYYRVNALRFATVRANLRQNLHEDKEEVSVWYEYFYHLLKGEGTLIEQPRLETLHHRRFESHD